MVALKLAIHRSRLLNSLLASMSSEALRSISLLFKWMSLYRRNPLMRMNLWNPSPTRLGLCPLESLVLPCSPSASASMPRRRRSVNPSGPFLQPAIIGPLGVCPPPAIALGVRHVTEAGTGNQVRVTAKRRSPILRRQRGHPEYPVERSCPNEPNRSPVGPSENSLAGNIQDVALAKSLAKFLSVHEICLGKN